MLNNCFIRYGSVASVYYIEHLNQDWIYLMKRCKYWVMTRTIEGVGNLTEWNGQKNICGEILPILILWDLLNIVIHNCTSQPYNIYNLFKWPTNLKVKALYFLQLWKIEKKNYLPFLFSVAWNFSFGLHISWSPVDRLSLTM